MSGALDGKKRGKKDRFGFTRKMVVTAIGWPSGSSTPVSRPRTR